MLKLPDGTVKVLVEGSQRANIDYFTETEACFLAHIDRLEPIIEELSQQTRALMRSVLSVFDQYVKLHKKIPTEVLTSLAGIEDPGRLADTIAAHMALKLDEKQKVLEMQDIDARLEHLLHLIEAENDILQVEKRVRNRGQAADGEKSAGILFE